jgi:hypothetical protein
MIEERSVDRMEIYLPDGPDYRLCGDDSCDTGHGGNSLHHNIEADVSDGEYRAGVYMEGVRADGGGSFGMEDANGDELTGAALEPSDEHTAELMITPEFDGGKISLTYLDFGDSVMHKTPTIDVEVSR